MFDFMKWLNVLNIIPQLFIATRHENFNGLLIVCGRVEDYKVSNFDRFGKWVDREKKSL